MIQTDIEKTRSRNTDVKPYVKVTYEMSGTWMVLGSFEEYGEDPTELGQVILDLMRDADDAEERVVVAVTYMTDADAESLPEFPGW